MRAPALASCLCARLQVLLALERRFQAGALYQRQVVPSARLILVCEGAVEYIADQACWALEAGALCLVGAGCARSWQAGADGFAMRWVEFDAVDEELALGPPAQIISADPAVDAAALERIAAASGQPGTGNALLAEGELKALLARFLTAADPIPAERGGRAATGERRVRDALDWLARHCHDDEPLRDLPQRFGLSGNHFRALCRRLTGRSAREHLQHLRLARARALLHDSARSVAEIAELVGYRDPLYFSRAYRQHWGHPPTAERDAHP